MAASAVWCIVAKALHGIPLAAMGRFFRGYMIQRKVIKKTDILAMLDRITEDYSDGQFIPEEALYAGLRRLEITIKQDMTVFDYADQWFGVGMSGWPPAGYWPGNPQGKEVQVIATEDLEGAL